MHRMVSIHGLLFFFRLSNLTFKITLKHTLCCHLANGLEISARTEYLPISTLLHSRVSLHQELWNLVYQCVCVCT